MNADWISSQTVALVIGHMTDLRPAWLWSSDAQIPQWRNAAANLLKPGNRRKGKSLGALVPIRGQVARSVRLGALGRASLSRMQFTANGKPISLTCTCTPLKLEDGRTGLLIVGVDPVDKKTLAEAKKKDFDIGQLLGEGVDVVGYDSAGKVFCGTKTGRRLGADLKAHGEDAVSRQFVQFDAGDDGELLLAFLPQVDLASGVSESGMNPVEDLDAAEDLGWPQDDAETELLADAGPEDELTTAQPEATEDDDGDGDGENVHRELSGLLDQLADDEALFSSLDESDNAPEEHTDETDQGPEQPEHIDERAADEDDQLDASEPDDVPPADDTTGKLWRIIGRDFKPNDDSQKSDRDPDQDADIETSEVVQLHSTVPPDDEAVERASRYNFDELSRILMGQVGEAPSASHSTTTPERLETESGALVNLSDETLILNRLPLGLLVFRDQKILFSNRALVELIGYRDTDGLRAAGLGAIFPAEAANEHPAGPVTQLVRADGSHIGVTARLQSISWQGQPALLLSARGQDEVPSGEAAARAFAQTLADAEDGGFFATDRAGIITAISELGAQMIGHTRDSLIGRPVHGLAALDQGGKLRTFLELPARFAGVARPHVRLDGVDPSFEVLIFAEGHAGLVSGYFGLLQKLPEELASVDPTTSAKDDNNANAELLARVSRSVRRPLNTIVGFSELIRSQAFGPLENQRYVEYARDIETAGQEIVAVVDEIEDFAKLQDDTYVPAASSFDLGLLLDSCIARVRMQAGAARVLIRSAISDRLPRIKADETSLRQAVLNLLASAIEQTPEGGQVVISAQQEPDGSMIVHVRDSSEMRASPEERFVVFRDGVGPDGLALKPVPSVVGLALTRTLLAVNACSLDMAPTLGPGTLMSLVMPADLVVRD